AGLRPHALDDRGDARRAAHVPRSARDGGGAGAAAPWRTRSERRVDQAVAGPHMKPPDREAGLTHRTLAGLAWTGGGKAVYAVLRLLVLFLLARLLSPADFGVVGAAGVVIGFSSILSELGVAPAIVQRPERIEENPITTDRKSTRLNSVTRSSRMPSSA